jgi:ATP-dependent protease HslVU (ClpYQ) peptidase subunit
MTIIVAMKHKDGDIQMAADGRVTSGDLIISDTNKKLIELPYNHLIGCAGDTSLIQRFVHFLHNKVESDNTMLGFYQQLLWEFWDKHNLPLLSDETWLETVFIDGYKDIWVSYDCECHQCKDFIAIGHGRTIALGAYEAGETDAAKIVEIVCKHISCCGGLCQSAWVRNE